MIQLTYISSAVPGLIERDVADILKASRNNNAPAGVTGLLLYNGRRFLQALEGESGAVNIVYRRIKTDRRHRACVLLSSTEISQRAFGSWAMAAQPIDGSAPRASLIERVEQLTSAIADPTIRAHFRSFAALPVPNAS